MKLPSWLRVVLVLLGLALLVGVGWVAHLRGSGMPWRDGERSLTGLSGEVQVTFDGLGVPHIDATSTLDAVAALGWIHANDRFTQMELGRRAAAGRLSEILGDATLDVDIHLRTLRFPETAERLASVASDRSQAWLGAYARGVNAWLAARGSDLPPALRILGVEPEPWRPADSLAFVLLMANDLSFWDGRPEEGRFVALRSLGAERLRDLLDAPDLAIDPEILALAERLGPPTVAALGDGASLRLGRTASPGSNNWAVGSSRTASGEGLLANDPHLGLTLPSVWYQAQVRSPEYAAAGMTLPGVPGVVLGRGTSVAWAFTNTMLDDHDLFAEQVDLEVGTVLRGDTWQPMESYTVEIEVRGKEPHSLTLWTTDLGPLLLADEGAGLPARSLAWTLYDDGDPLAALAAVASAETPEQLLAGIEPYVGPAQNLVASFASGELVFTVLGAIPHRAGEVSWSSDGPSDTGFDDIDRAPDPDVPEEQTTEASVVEDPSRSRVDTGNGRMLSPGWVEGVGWGEQRPRATHPRVVRPASDRLVTANNDIRPPGYSAPLAADFFPGDRARRIEEELDRHEAWDVEGFATLQNDVVSLYARDLCQAMAKVLAGAQEGDLDGDLAADAAKALATLESWNGSMALRGAAALFVLVERQLFEVFFADEGKTVNLAPLIDSSHLSRLLEGRLDPAWADDVTTPGTESIVMGVERALAQAWREGSARWGNDPTQWDYGALHTLTLAHPLDALPVFGSWARRGPLEVPGAGHTVNAFGAAWRGDKLEVTFGPSMRWVVDWSQPDRAFAALPGGQSGHPADPHYDDRLAGFLAGELDLAPWSPEAIDQVAVSTLRLVP